MKRSLKPALALAFGIAVVFFHAHAIAGRPYPCKVKGAPPFKAELSNEGTMNRSIQVTFSKRPSSAEATTVVQACVKMAAVSDPTHDALGTAWVGDNQVKLSGGGPYAYEAGSKSYRFITSIKLTPK
jgi:hypothetical protein